MLEEREQIKNLKNDLAETQAKVHIEKVELNLKSLSNLLFWNKGSSEYHNIFYGFMYGKILIPNQFR